MSHETRVFALPSLEGGALLATLGREQTELLKFMRSASDDAGEAKLKGKIIVTIDYTVIGATIDLAGEFAVKKPKLKRKTERQWVGKEGQLLGAPPKQEALPFGVRAVPNPKKDEGETDGQERKVKSV